MSPPETRRPQRWAQLATIATVLLVLLAAGAEAQDAAAGKATYDKYCAQCHGERGDGHGIATPYLRPQPRDFTAGKYKVRTTPTGNLPTDQDIERAIRRGLAYTAMPAFRESVIPQAQLEDLVAYLKAFSPDFAGQPAPEPITIAPPPPYDPELAATKGREVYQATGCAACHGALGRGDGPSAPALVDDWNNPIRVADLTKPWTFRGGGTREDIFRTMSTGFAGTPMPGFLGALPPEDIWAITDYMLSLSGGPQEADPVKAPYANVVTAKATRDAIDLKRGDELFAQAPAALFPLLGQVIEPGRNFYPAANAIEVQAIYNQDEIAFRLVWHDIRADTTGQNAPDMAVPLWAEQLIEAEAAAGGAADEDDPWGDAAADAGADPWGEDAAEEGDGTDEGFWGDDAGAADSAADAGESFSDAVALQFPEQLPQGVRKPYFLFGDAQNAVTLWFADLAAAQGDAAQGDAAQGELWTGHGSSELARSEAEPPEVRAHYDEGAWVVLMKHARASRGNLSFEPETFVPIAFSVWDGFNRERGNKRALSAWWDLYLEPLERPSPVAPMAKAFFGILVLELLIVGLVRWRRRSSEAREAGAPAAQTA